MGSHQTRGISSPRLIPAKVKSIMKKSQKVIEPSQNQEEALMVPEEETPKPKFEIYAEEMIEKKVRPSGRSGRIYLPPEWVGKHVKVIRLD